MSDIGFACGALLGVIAVSRVLHWIDQRYFLLKRKNSPIYEKVISKGYKVSFL